MCTGATEAMGPGAGDLPRTGGGKEHKEAEGRQPGLPQAEAAEGPWARGMTAGLHP